MGGEVVGFGLFGKCMVEAESIFGFGRLLWVEW